MIKQEVKCSNIPCQEKIIAAKRKYAAGNCPVTTPFDVSYATVITTDVFIW